MKKKEPGVEPFPPTTVRLDPELRDKAHAVARKHKRMKQEGEDTFSRVVNAALAAYLAKKSG